MGITEFEVGYLCGLIVGEGSFTGDKKHPHLAVKMQHTDEEPIRDLQRLLGGKVYEYIHDGRHYFLWLLRGNELKRWLWLFDLRLPISRKRRQYETWKVKYALA